MALVEAILPLRQQNFPGSAIPMWQKLVPEKKHTLCRYSVYIYMYIYGVDHGGGVSIYTVYIYIYIHRKIDIYIRTYMNVLDPCVFLMFFVYLPAFTIAINHSWIGKSTTSHGSVMG